MPEDIEWFIRNKKKVDEKYAYAQKTRLEGNEHFKAGDTKKALLSYHLVLMNLRGLDNETHIAYPPPPRQPDLPPKAPSPPPSVDSMQYKIQNTILLTHCNMAACHAKNENWQRCLQCAESALKIDPENKKACYREAQALINLGQVQEGKSKLSKLQEQGHDPAVAALLKQLEADEKAREKKANKAMSGFLKQKDSDGSVVEKKKTPTVEAKE